MIKIIDNFLEKDLIEYLEKLFIYNTPHYYGHASNEKSNKFYCSNLNTEDTLIKYLIIKLKKNFKFNQVIHSYINIQYNEMNGDWHSDVGSHTIILMITKTLKKDSGQFEIKDNEKINKIDFIQNRLIYFDATKQHRGMDPKEINTPRITLVFKTI
jgi:hypothetical protein